MGTWFDRLAKRTAQPVAASSADDGFGLTRRQVIARGAVITGAAWTAPMLMSVRPAFAGASQCSGTTDYQDCGNGTFQCCPSGQICGTFPDGQVGCTLPLGGACGNQGQGVESCNFGRSRCNQTTGDPKRFPSTCGGPGAVCDPNSSEPVCVAGVECSDGSIDGDTRCGGQGAVCSGAEDCAPQSTVNQPATTCVGLVCTEAA